MGTGGLEGAPEGTVPGSGVWVGPTGRVCLFPDSAHPPFRGQREAGSPGLPLVRDSEQVSCLLRGPELASGLSLVSNIDGYCFCHRKFVVTKGNIAQMYHAPGRKREFNAFVLDKTYFGPYDETTHIDWTDDSK